MPNKKEKTADVPVIQNDNVDNPARAELMIKEMNEKAAAIAKKNGQLMR